MQASQSPLPTADHSHGAVALVLVLVVFTLVCRAVAELWPDGDGMHEYRQ